MAPPETRDCTALIPENWIVLSCCLIPGADGAPLSSNLRDALWDRFFGRATTTEAIRRAIQHSQESLRSLSKRYGINPKTVAKSKKPGSVANLKTGPWEAKSTVLSIEDEAIIVAFRKHTLSRFRIYLCKADIDIALPSPSIPGPTARCLVPAFAGAVRAWRSQGEARSPQ